MDPPTTRRKLDNRDYPTAQRFYDDFKLMVKNCVLFNLVGTPVCNADQELDNVFNEKWQNLPPLRAVQVSEDEDDDLDDGNDIDVERLRKRHVLFCLSLITYLAVPGAIAQLEAQIETIRNNL